MEKDTTTDHESSSCTLEDEFASKTSEIEKGSSSLEREIADLTNNAKDVYTTTCTRCSNDAKFFCNTCRCNLCDSKFCIEKHRESPSAETVQTHDIVYFEKNMELYVHMCKEHPTKIAKKYCRTCAFPICNTHCQEKHGNHKGVDIKSVFRQKTIEITKHNDILNYSVKRKFLTEIKNMDDNLLAVQNNYQKIRNNIYETGVKWHTEVDKMITCLRDSLLRLEEDHVRSLKEQKEHLCQELRKIEDVIERNDSILKTQLGLIQYQSDIHIQTLQQFPAVTKYTLPVFRIGNYEHLGKQINSSSHVACTPTYQIPVREVLSKSCLCLAELTNVEKKVGRSFHIEPKPLFSRVAKEISSCKSESGFVKDIDVASCGLYWVCSTRKEVVQINHLGTIEVTIPTSVPPQYLTTVSENRVLFSDHNDNSIKMIANNEITAFHKIPKSWIPMGLMRSMDGYILNCQHNGNHGRVVRYGMGGQELHVIEYTHDSNPLFELPECIAENRNGDICITDTMKKAVIVVNRIGEFQFSYRGQIAANKISAIISWRYTSFNPKGVTTDSRGHILISDACSKSVHIINQWGQFLEVLQFNFVSPRCLAINQNENLLVAENDNDIKEIQYLTCETPSDDWQFPDVDSIVDGVINTVENIFLK